MVIPAKHTSVLIVGAGPSGLMMAAQLLRYGIQPVIVDSKQGPTDQSKALAVQARSLEIYRQMGIVNRIIAGGKEAKGASFNIDGKVAAAFSLQNMGEGQTLYPYMHLYPQSKNERALLDFLTLNCCPVYWETSLVALKQSAGQVEVHLQQGEKSSSFNCDYLIGADGPHSTVRKQLNIPFSGDTYKHLFYLADAELDNNEFNCEEVQLFLGKKGFSGFFPMPEINRYRIIGILPKELDGKEDLKIEDVLPQIKEITQIQLNITHCHWFTTYKLHHRMAERFREQRCFLIGDAAHIHSPVGGQGMNTGLQDAHNLAWKLAGVVNGQIAEKILDSYADERMPVAKELLRTTDRIFTTILSGGWLASLFNRWILPHLLKFAWRNAAFKEAFFKRVSQTGISYHDSNINLHLSTATQIKAGDRLPYLKIYDKKKQEESDLHQWCSKPGFTLIIFGKLTESDLFSLARWITQNYQGMLNFFYLPPSTKNQHVFNAFQIAENQAKSLIVRPDMHIGFINDKVDMGLMDNYLRNVVGVVHSRREI